MGTALSSSAGVRGVLAEQETALAAIARFEGAASGEWHGNLLLHPEVQSWDPRLGPLKRTLCWGRCKVCKHSCRLLMPWVACVAFQHAWHGLTLLQQLHVMLVLETCTEAASYVLYPALSACALSHLAGPC